MNRTRKLVPLDRLAAAQRCLCDREPRFLLMTATEMGGKFRGQGKIKVTRNFRCDVCVFGVAQKFGLNVPSAN